jgi:hypothetical protein
MIHSKSGGRYAFSISNRIGPNAYRCQAAERPRSVAFHDIPGVLAALFKGVVRETLGVSGEAATRKFVDLALAIDQLRKTNYRCSAAWLKATLDRFKTGSPPIGTIES